MDCPLCLEPLTDSHVTNYVHPVNDTCTGFDVHTSCLADYIHNHLTKNTNLVCTTCREDLSPLHRPAPVVRNHRLREIVDQHPRARLRIEPNALIHTRFTIPTSYTDVIHTIVGGVEFIQIITGNGRLHDYFNLGLCTIYAYGRVRGHIRGGTRKRGAGKPRSHTFLDSILGPNEFAIIDVYPDKNNHSLIIKLENIVGYRVINLDTI